MSGVLISVACTYFFAKGEFAEQLVRMSNEFDKRYSSLQQVNTDLNNTIKDKLGPMATQMGEVKEQLPELTDKVDTAVQTASTAAVRSKQAASTASRAASQAGQAVKKAKEPVGSIRIKQQPVWREPKCYMGRDLYGDPCN